MPRRFSRRMQQRQVGAMAVLLPLLTLPGCRRNEMPDAPDGYREFAYVANQGSASVSVLDLVLLKPDHTVPVAADPVSVAANPKRNEVYVVSRQNGQASGSLTILDTTRGVVASVLPLGRSPEAVVVAPDGLRAYVVQRGSDSVSEIDLNKRPRAHISPRRTSARRHRHRRRRTLLGRHQPCRWQPDALQR